MATQKKIDTVSELTEKASRAKAMFLVDYRGLKHKQTEELRKLLKKTEAEFTIAKNRLLFKSIGDNAEAMKEALNDTTAALFAFADEVAPLKEIVKFFKANGVGKLKAGMLGNQVLTEADMGRLATLPSRNVLLAQLAGQLNAPIQGLHRAMSWNIQKLVYAFVQIQSSKSK